MARKARDIVEGSDLRAVWRAYAEYNPGNIVEELDAHRKIGKQHGYTAFAVRDAISSPARPLTAFEQDKIAQAAKPKEPDPLREVERAAARLESNLKVFKVLTLIAVFVGLIVWFFVANQEPNEPSDREKMKTLCMRGACG